MSGFKWLIDQYFQLPKWERIGNIILLVFILITIGIVSLWPEKQMTLAEEMQLDKLEAKLENQKKEFDFTNKTYYKNYKHQNYKNSYSNDTTSSFIPDLSKATVKQLQKAGLNRKVAYSIFNYLQKGGKIKSEKDIRKIYGMTDEMAKSLISHTQFDTSQLKKFDNKTFVKKENGIIDLNLADSSQLVLVRGISPKMVPYILKFRNSIGAFHSVEQLNEVFKNPLSNFEEIKIQITITGFKPIIKINSISAVELKKHKYFAKDNLASTLVAYREKHGKFNIPEDLKKCVLVTDELLVKITPYLIFD